MDDRDRIDVPDLGDASGSLPAGSQPLRATWLGFPWKTAGAVCCSGGGIRSASFCLGALQALDAAGVEPGLITAVSGGSYIAASRALLWQSFDPADDPSESPPAGSTADSPSDPAGDPPPYRPQSAEEHHLRTHTKYIAPSFRIGLTGVAALVVGAAITVALVSSVLFVFGQVWGALLGPQHLDVLTGLNSPNPTATLSKWWWWIWAAAVGGIALLCFVLSGVPGIVRAGRERRPSRVAVQAGGAAVLLSIAMLLVPLAIASLFRVGLYNGAATGTIVRGLGFSSKAACESAYKSQAAQLPNPEHDTVCGAPVKPKLETFTTPSGNPLAKLVAFFTAVAGLAKTALGRWSTVSKGGQGKSWIQSLGRAVRGFVVPWLGTIVIVSAFALVTLRWTGDGALSGFHWWVLLVLLIPLAGRAVIDVNRMSLHDFYRWRLSEAYGYSRKLAATDNPSPKALANARSRRLSELTRGPMLAICTAANADGYGLTPAGLDAFLFRFDREHATLYGPPRAGRAHVVTARTMDYEALAGLTLFDLVAISGAAVSPLMGKATRQAMRILLTVTNARLGVWLPNPAIVQDARTWVDEHSFHEFVPGPSGSGDCAECGHPRAFPAHQTTRNGESLEETNLNWDRNKIGRKPRWPLMPLLGHTLMRRQHSGVLWGHALWYQERAKEQGSRSWQAWMLWRAMQPTLGLLWKESVASSGYRQEWVYASDGGHYENLGLVAALLDESIHHVIALDASGDQTDTWNTIGQAIALARSDGNVEVDLDPTSMKASHDALPGYVSRPFAGGSFRRPAGRSGVASDDGKASILVCKLGVWDKAPWDVRGYAATHKAFPCDSTGQQLYDGDEFEAYRSLGSAAVGAAQEQEVPPLQPGGAGPAPVDVARAGLEPAADAPN